MLTHVLLVLMIQQAVSKISNININISVSIDDCIPTGESKRGLIDPCEGNPEPAINTKCCSPKDKSNCVSTLMFCNNIGVCSCKPEEENDNCIPTGQSQTDLIDDCDGIKPDKEVKCCSAKEQITCVHTSMLCDNLRRCTCKAKEENDGCIPTGQSQTDMIDDCDGIKPDKEVKCCSAKDQISCANISMLCVASCCKYTRRCTCKAKEDNDDGCIPTGETKAGIVDDKDGNIIMKCCSSRAEISCWHTLMSGNNRGACTCK